MSDDDKIVIPIELQVDEESAQAAADSVQRAISKAAARSNITPEEFTARHDATKASQAKDKDSKAPPNLEAAVLGETNKEIGASAEGVRLFREALHVLHPALEEAGIGMGGMTSLIRAATGGIVALGAALAGLIATGLEKAADAATTASTQIGTFAGSISLGRQQYEQLDQTAGGLHVPTSDLVPSYTELQRTNQIQRPSDQLAPEQLNAVIKTVTEGAQSERVDTSKALEGLTNLVKEAREKGVVTPGDITKDLGAIPKTLAEIVTTLQKMFPGQQTYTAPQVLSSIRGAGPQVSANLINEQSQNVEDISAAFTHLKGSAERLAAIIPIGNPISGTLTHAANVIDDILAGIDHAKKAAEKGAKEQQAFNPHRETSGTLTNPLTNAPVNVAKPLSFQRPEFVDHAEEDRKQTLASLTRFDDELNHLGDTTANAAKKIDDFAKDPEKLGNVGKVLSEQKAAIDLKYEDKETANKITADEIRLDNADIHVAEAKLNLSEADKRSALAGLAPEQASNAVNDAADNRDKALSNFFKHRGVDTTALDAANASVEDIDKLNDAETALKVAQVNRKYAGLQPAEAQLGQEKAATELRSADLEKNDASLTLAKDKDGAPIAHEYAQLKYADASLKAQGALEQLTKDELGTLKDILNAIVKSDQGRDDSRIGKLSGPSSGDGSGSVDNTSSASSGTARQSSGNGTTSTSYIDKDGHPVVNGVVNRNQTNLHPNSLNQPLQVADQSRPNNSNQIDKQQQHTTTNGYRTQSDPNYDPFRDAQKFRANSKEGEDLDHPREPDVTPIGRPGDGFMHPPRQDFGDGRSGIYDQGPYSHNPNDPYDNSSKWNSDHGVTYGTGPGQTPRFSDDTTVPLPLPRPPDAPKKGHYDPVTGQFVVDGYTEGGYVTGPGTTTSDSINAQLSDKEFVHNAKAVEYYGVDNMHALNRMEIPRFGKGGLFAEVGNAINNFTLPKFSIGSIGAGIGARMNSVTVPRFSAGGTFAENPQLQSSGDRHLIDLRTDHGTVRDLRGSDTSLSTLKQAALMKASIRTGKSQSWDK
jgi:hypothetical protein